MFDGCNYVFRDRIWLRVIRCWWSPHRWRNSWNFADLNWGSPSELRISFKTSCADNWLSLSSSELRYSVQTRLTTAVWTIFSRGILRISTSVNGRIKCVIDVSLILARQSALDPSRSIDRLPGLSNSNEDHRRSPFATTPYIDDLVI